MGDHKCFSNYIFWRSSFSPCITLFLTRDTTQQAVLACCTSRLMTKLTVLASYNNRNPVYFISFLLSFWPHLAFTCLVPTTVG